MSKAICHICNNSRVAPRRLEDGSLYLDDCSCVPQMVREGEYEKANIPKQYWDFGIEDVDLKYRENNKKQLDRVNVYMQNLEDNIANGKGLWFCSAPGLGKSTIIVSILKLALEKGYQPYFTRASKIVSQKFEALKRDSLVGIVLDRIVRSVDILAMEEIDKIYLANSDDAMNNQMFYEFLSDMYDAKKALLVSSNKLPKEVLSKFPTFVQDRLRSLVPIIFVGLTGRRAKTAT